MIKIKFEELFTFENIYRAHMRGASGKHAKRSIVRFEMRLLQNISEIYRAVHKRNYTPVPCYPRFVVYEPKKREIQTLPYQDRIIQHVLCDNVLAPYFTERAVVDNCVCQIGKGTHFALRRFETKLREFTRKHQQHGYFLKCDILKYFPSLAHWHLREVFSGAFKDLRLRQLVTQIIESCHTEPEFLAKYDIPPIDEGNGKTNRGIALITTYYDAHGEVVTDIENAPVGTYIMRVTLPAGSNYHLAGTTSTLFVIDEPEAQAHAALSTNDSNKTWHIAAIAGGAGILVMVPLISVIFARRRRHRMV